MERQLSAPEEQRSGQPGQSDHDPAHQAGPHLSFNTQSRPVTGIVLVMHGGRVDSFEPTSPWQPAVLRLTWLARAIRHRLSPAGVAVARLRFSVRGWNGRSASPVSEARWAIRELRAQYNVPIVLVGHSMGGRTAVRVADEDGVAGVIALAPWLPPGESVRPLTGRHLVIVHGTRDRITDPAQSAAFGERARAVASDVQIEFVPGDGHAMVRKAPAWHRLTAGHARQLLGEVRREGA